MNKRNIAPTIEAASNTLAKLERDAQATANCLQDCQRELENVLIAHQEGTMSGSTLEQVRKALATAQQKDNDARLLVTGAKRRLQEAREAERAQLIAQKWEVTRLHAAERRKLAEEVEQAAAVLGALVSRLEATTEAIRACYPGKADPAGSMLAQANLHSAIKETIQLHGAMPWQPGSLWDLQHKPSLAERVECANEFMEMTQNG